MAATTARVAAACGGAGQQLRQAARSRDLLRRPRQGQRQAQQQAPDCPYDRSLAKNASRVSNVRDAKQREPRELRASHANDCRSR